MLRALLLGGFCLLLHGLIAQTTPFDSTVLDERTAKGYLHALSAKCSKLQGSLDKQTAKMLARMQKQEAKLKSKLAKKDFAKAAQLFNGTEAQYQQLQAKLNQAGTIGHTATLKEYIPSIDSFKTSLSFLEKSPIQSPELASQLAGTKAQLQQLESKMQVANEIKKQIKARKQQLKQQLEGVLPLKDLTAINKEVYYYQQQLNEYKALLADRKKLEQKALKMLKESSVFKDFMKQNSMLAQLFRVPDNYGSAASLQGLQTRAGVQQLLEQRLAAGGPNAQQALQQNLQQAQEKMNELKAKLNKLGGGNGNLEMPEGFTPNSQRTKTFWQRIEYGMNMQSQRARGILPSTSDIALTAGYKINDKSTIGVGVAYKLGWGNGWNHIRLTHEGVGLRSFIDLKLKGSFWMTGGYEKQYQQRFGKIADLKGVSWQTSGLIGITKKYKVGNKTGNLQLLWDFLSYQQTPKTPALQFRVGWNF